MKGKSKIDINETRITQEIVINKVVFNVTSIFTGTKDLKTILTERVIEKVLAGANI
ncbi:hypothetical protein [Chakrabartyella piscis]|uniref:hypothetical protein n=1 Tax=Chakrabartyella piscis TaxID=2918914 RepID=UPI0029587A43|nr:hypothetical protein [Chakrabartyella piscis]